jgi:hypothetical protein
MSGAAQGPVTARVFVFIDLSELLAELGGLPDAVAALDWEGFPAWLAVDAASAALLTPAARLRYAGTLVYVLDEPARRSGRAARAAGAPDGVSGVIVRLANDPQVEVRVVRATAATAGDCLACDLARTPGCRHCRNTTSPLSCLGGAVGDAIATDIFRLVREDALDVAVLLSAEPALRTVIRFVEGRGKRVVHAAFPPRGRESSEVSSGMVDLTALRP